MKICPICKKEYEDSKAYCKDDGAKLMQQDQYQHNRDDETTQNVLLEIAELHKKEQRNRLKPIWVTVFILCFCAVVAVVVIYAATGIINLGIWKISMPIFKSENTIDHADIFIKGSDSTVWEKLRNCGENSECVAMLMRENGATERSIAFTRKIFNDRGSGFISDFRGNGKVNIVAADFPGRANTNSEFFMVNGSPSIVSVIGVYKQNINNINIRMDANYPAIAQKCPQVELWADPGWPHEENLSNGYQRFVFGFPLLNGCHACEVCGAAEVAFDFDKTGKFQGISFIGLSPARK